MQNGHQGYIVRVECQRIRSALGTTPEWLASACEGIFRETEKKLADVVVVVTFKLKAGPNNTFFECQGLIGDKVGNNLFDLFLLLTRVLKCALQVVGFREVGIDSLSRLDEELIELSSAPLYVGRTSG